MSILKKMHPPKDGSLRLLCKVYENEKNNMHNLGRYGNLLVMSVNSTWSLSFLITEACLLWV